MRNDLVVVHTKAGKLVKGYLRWVAASCDSPSLPALPDVLHISHDNEGEISSIDLDDAKAVFFVRTQEGNVEYSEVKFFTDHPATELWVQVQLADQESVEGRVENCSRLLFEPGFWLRPTDCVANNIMVYVPKSSIVDFRVMGLATVRKRVAEEAASDTNSTFHT